MKRAISKKVILYLEDNVSMSLKAVGCLLTSLNKCNYVLLEHKMLPLKSIRTGNEQKTAKMVKKIKLQQVRNFAHNRPKIRSNTILALHFRKHFKNSQAFWLLAFRSSCHSSVTKIILQF